MKKSILVVISLCIASFQLYAQKTPSRIEKNNFPDVKEIRFEHSFGNITVLESASSQVELEIRYFDGDEEDIKPISNISSTGKFLEIRTEIPSKPLKKRFFRTYDDGNKATIDYIIAVPKDVAMQVNLKYGNINMGDFYGDFKCDLGFGSLSASTFHKSPVIISSKYSTVGIDKVDVLDLSIDFGNIKATTINIFKAKSKYSTYKIGTVNSMYASCSFGSVGVESVVELEASLKYCPTNIEYLDKELDIECGYSDIRVGASSKHLETVIFDGSYSNFRLGIDDDLSANLNVNIKYGNLQVDEKHHVKYSFSEKDHNRVTKKGTIGDKTPTANIRISNSFANVKIR
jgi:hypothetical protein